MGKTLYTHADIITVDEKRSVIRDGALLVDDTVIAAVGKTDELLKLYPDAEVCDCAGCIMMPGLVNAHIHLAQNILKCLADDMELFPWLTDRIWPIQGAYTPERFLASARLSMAEMLLGGTTTFVESMTVKHYGIESLAEAVGESGMRGMLAKVVMEPLPGQALPPSMTEEKEESFAIALAAKKRYDGAFGDRVRIWLGPRWTGMFNDSLMRDVVRYMDEYGFYTTIHYAEEEPDVKAIFEATGMTPAAYLRSRGAARKETLLIHCTALPEGDEELLAEDGVSVAYCPAANMKGAIGVCRAYDMAKAGVNVALGTDAQACDNNADMLLSMRFGSLIQKYMKMDPTAVPAEQIIEMATINGAKAIGMADQIGSLEAGKKADFILIDTKRARMRPMPNPVAAAAYTATGDCVKTVVIDGKVVVRDRKLLTMDEGELILEAEEVRKEMCREAGIDADTLTTWKVL